MRFNGCVRAISKSWTINKSSVPLGYFSRGTRQVSLQNGGRYIRGRRSFTSTNYAYARSRLQKLVQLEDIGTESLEDTTPPVLETAYPTVLAQVRRNMIKFENCIVLTRVGGFYELYFEHAEKFGPQLHLKVASKQTTNGPVAMSGFPFMQLDKFLKILVQDLNQYVAIAEEFPNDAIAKIKSGGNLFERKVTRVITPGTLIDENFMDPYANNYILAIHMADAATTNLDNMQSTPPNDNVTSTTTSVGVAWLDLSTGQFQTQSTTVSMLSSVITRVGPREIVLDNLLSNVTRQHPILIALAEDQRLVTFASRSSMTADSKGSTGTSNALRELEHGEAAKIFTSEERVAGARLLDYIDARLLENNLELQSPIRYSPEENMIIDKNTMRALELKQTLRESGATKGTLLHAIRRTITKSGARLLEERLSAPSTRVDIINERLDLVEFMYENHLAAEQVRRFLSNCDDSRRLAQKFAYGRGTADDLIALANTIRATEQLKAYVQSGLLRSEVKSGSRVMDLVNRITLNGPQLLANRIRATIDEEGVNELQRSETDSVIEVADLAEQVAASEGSIADVQTFSRRAKKKKPTSIREHYANDGDVWMMKPTASTGLEKLHSQLSALEEQKITLTESLQERIGVTTLSLRWTPGLGHICHIKARGKEKPHLSQVIPVSSSKSTQSFHHTEWTSLGKEIDHVKLRIRSEENAVFSEIRQQVIHNLFKIRQNAAVLDELDVACSFAQLASEQNLTRPIINNGVGHKIIAGRHPTVQSGLNEQGRSFISNDCFVGSPARIWFITGPNMAGKSTFLRQNALITVMAQIGSFVPAEYAEIGIVDQIFSRVGSADNLFRDQSTFMIEMLESATILKHATPRSFVIMDEIGRGTTPEDGVAVAFACMHHLYHTNQCRTLFATHFHELADLAQDMKEVDHYCTDVVEDADGGFGYVHKLRRGINRESHALKVARIAGVPAAAIKVAEDVLAGKISKMRS